MVVPLLHRSENYDHMKVESIYISKKEPIKDLKEKITRILKSNSAMDLAYLNTTHSRLWALDQKDSPEQLKQKLISSKDGSTVLKGKILEDNSVLEVKF